MLRLNNVHKIFNYGKVNENYVLKDINLQVARGDFITIIGSNGAGKSTLLNLVAGTLFPEAGKGPSPSKKPEHNQPCRQNCTGCEA